MLQVGPSHCTSRAQAWTGHSSHSGQQPAGGQGCNRSVLILTHSSHGKLEQATSMALLCSNTLSHTLVVPVTPVVARAELLWIDSSVGGVCDLDWPCCLWVVVDREG